MRIAGALAALAVLVAAMTIGDSFGAPPAQADHGDDRPPVLMHFYRVDRHGKAEPAPRNADGSRSGIPAIARSLVNLGRGTASQPIAVCSEAKYKEPTETAVAVWNDSLEAMTGHKVEALEYIGVCPANPDPERARLRIVVRALKDPQECRGDAGEADFTACAVSTRIRGAPHYTYFGEGLVLVNKLRGNDHQKAATIAHEIGHLLGLAHPYESGYTAVANVLDLYAYVVSKCPGALEYHQVKWNGTRWVGTGKTFTNPSHTVPQLSAYARTALTAVTDARHGGALMLPTSNCRGDRKKSDSEWKYEVGKPRLRTYDQQAYESLSARRLAQSSWMRAFACVGAAVVPGDAPAQVTRPPGPA